MRAEETSRSNGRSRRMRPRRRASDLEFMEIDGEIVIYDELDDAIHHLNPTASMIWLSCDGTATIAELAGQFAAAAGLPHGQIEGDITSAVRELSRAGLMQVPKRRANVTPGDAHGG